VEALVKAGRNVIIVGDVNACHKPIDHCDYVSPSPRSEREPFENANREWLGKFLVDGGGMFVDVFRRFHPDRQKAYTCWNTKTGARLSNYGARIDYILANIDLYESGFFTRCDIRPDIHCSDHCPVEADIDVATLCNDPNRVPPPLCSRFMPEFSGAQQNIKSFFTKGPAAGPAAASLTVGTSKDSSPSTSPTASPSKVASLKRPHSLPTSTSSSSVGPPSKTQKLNYGGKKGVQPAADKKTVSLHSFFGASQAPKEKSAATKAAPGAMKAEPMDLSASSTAVPILPAGSPGTIAAAYAASASTPSPHFSPPPSGVAAPPGAPAAQPSVDPAAAWKTLLNQKSDEMKCKKHHLRCKLLTVGKPGVNHGREFYICALVPPDRCDFFEWKTKKKS
jgi:AP endonuclease-2